MQVNKKDELAFEKFFLGRTKNFSCLAVFHTAGWAGLCITENENSTLEHKDMTKIFNLEKRESLLHMDVDIFSLYCQVKQLY